ncbi:sodium/glucose cotransporter 5 [Lingula anatina]|uniref:Sodium/glucose cotransporter 5 n=1 Tax=Lingula anatina TaxID=7574 RepID=A0A1S3HJG8_LINAN|nr:sodium/glucose cotransporter 5 [Lingula anatina]|eukprot:XP_013386157.1 sodium/glucose cotransporter 5 [Lingula anatina]
MEQGLDHWADILVVVLYFVFVLAVGLWSLCRPNRSSVKGYFLAGRDMIWWPVGASLFASNIGSEHFIGLAGTGAASGIAIVMYEWSSMPLVMLLAWVFLPVYLASGAYTLPGYLQKRFGGQRLRVYISFIALVLYIVTKLAVSIYAGALFIQLALGWDMYVSIVVLLAVTAVFTVLGGLAAVIYTDTFQTIVMMIGAVVLMAIGFVKVGGYNNLILAYTAAVPTVRDLNSTCGFPREDAFHMFRDPVTSDLPWPGLILQSTIGCLWYWCADQVIVQRALAAKSITHAKGGAILAGYLKLLPIFIMILPGMMARALYPEEVACVDPAECEKYCGNPVGCSNIAYPKLVLTLLPVGLRGLLMAVMMSAIMSSLTSIFNSASSIFTLDLWRRFRGKATERELLIVGRVFILFMCVISILWIPLVKSSQGGQLFIYIQAVQGYLGTPIGALFLLAIAWGRMNEQGAFWGILAGHTCGVIRMILDFSFPGPKCGEPETRPEILYKVHYSYFGSLTIVVTSLVTIVVSLLTKPLDQRLCGLTWKTRWDAFRGIQAGSPSDAVDVSSYASETGAPDYNPVPMVAVQKSQDTNLEKETKSETGINGMKELTAKEQILEGTEENKIEHQEESMSTETKTTILRHWVHFVCGIPEIAQASVNDAAVRMAAMIESSKWRFILNVNAVIALAIMMFLCGFFA